MAQSHMSRLVRSVLDAQLAGSAPDEAVRANLRAHATFPEIKVYIGLNDSVTKKQEHDTERFVSLLKEVCVSHKVPFSFDIINGGYIHDDGEYTEEKTIVLTFIDVDKATVESIAQHLCELFNQESVLITIGLVKTQMIYAAETTDEQE